MDVTQLNRPPGSAATGAQLPSGVFFGIAALAMALLAVVFLLITPMRGHLTLPALQWAFGTPLGVLVLIAAAIAVAGPPYALAGRSALGRSLARAVDVTGLPPAEWPRRPRPGSSAARQAATRGRPSRWADGILLVVALAVGAAFIVLFVAATAYAWARIQRESCATSGCPTTYPVVDIALAATFAAMALSAQTQRRTVRWVEARCGIRFVSASGWLYYVRLPGIEPGAVAEALRPFAAREVVPGTRTFAWRIFCATPMVLLICAAVFLSGWLPGQWVPGP